VEAVSDKDIDFLPNKIKEVKMELNKL